MLEQIIEIAIGLIFVGQMSLVLVGENAPADSRKFGFFGLGYLFIRGVATCIFIIPLAGSVDIFKWLIVKLHGPIKDPELGDMTIRYAFIPGMITGVIFWYFVFNFAHNIYLQFRAVRAEVDCIESDISKSKEG